jgi:hypothetical protein
MTVEDANGIVQRLLDDEGFDVAEPLPALAWRAFKRFLEVPLAGLRTTTVGFTCEHVEDQDRTLWLQFCRLVYDEDGIGMCVGCGFSRGVVDGLYGVAVSNWWWAEHGTVSDWCAEVERSDAFVACVSLSQWHWMGYAL